MKLSRHDRRADADHHETPDGGPYGGKKARSQGETALNGSER